MRTVEAGQSTRDIRFARGAGRVAGAVGRFAGRFSRAHFTHGRVANATACLFGWGAGVAGLHLDVATWSGAVAGRASGFRTAHQGRSPVKARIAVVCGWGKWLIVAFLTRRSWRAVQGGGEAGSHTAVAGVTLRVPRGSDPFAAPVARLLDRVRAHIAC
jgi:hypothetical protein